MTHISFVGITYTRTTFRNVSDPSPLSLQHLPTSLFCMTMSHYLIMVDGGVRCGLLLLLEYVVMYSVMMI